MSDDPQQLPAPQSVGGGLIPLLVFFGALALLLLALLPGQPAAAPEGVDLSVAEKPTEVAAEVEPTAIPEPTTAPETAVPDAEISVQFVEPANEQEVESPFTAVFEANNFTIEPAGEIHEGAGHFHVLINTPFIEAGEVIPNDAAHRHFGTGALNAELDLPPGTYTLRLQAADGAHIALEGDSYRDEMTVYVLDENGVRVTNAPDLIALAEEAESEEQAEHTEEAEVVPMLVYADNARIQFVEPADGAEIGTTFTAVFQAVNVTVQPAGDLMDNTGHFHVLIDVPFIEAGEVIPNDEAHRHFGDGSLSAEFTLEPGEHTLRLQFADGAHRALEGDNFRDEITVMVLEE